MIQQPKTNITGANMFLCVSYVTNTKCVMQLFCFCLTGNNLKYTTNDFTTLLCVHSRVMKCLCKLIRVGLFMGFIWESKLVYNCLHSFSYDI